MNNINIARSSFLAGLLAILYVGSVHAQWVQTNAPWGGTIFSLAVRGTNLLAGTSGGVVLDDSIPWRIP